MAWSVIQAVTVWQIFELNFGIRVKLLPSKSYESGVVTFFENHWKTHETGFAVFETFRLYILIDLKKLCVFGHSNRNDGSGESK
jgi:hypothetical protein